MPRAKKPAPEPEDDFQDPEVELDLEELQAACRRLGYKISITKIERIVRMVEKGKSFNSGPEMRIQHEVEKALNGA